QGALRLPQEHSDDGPVAVRDQRHPELLQAPAKPVGALPQIPPEVLRLPRPAYLVEEQGSQHGARRRGEHEGASSVPEPIPDRRRPGPEAAPPPACLAPAAEQHVRPYAALGAKAGPLVAEDAEPVGFVDIEVGVVSIAQGT